MKEKELHQGVIPFLNCKDYLVSKETYEVMVHEENDMLVTSPIPADLDKYYESKENIEFTGEDPDADYNVVIDCITEDLKEEL